jgi:starvation-inducible DNA-binding protein
MKTAPKKTTKRQESSQDTPDLIEGLCQLLADTYLLYLKTQNFHWNVVGPHFYALHKLFEEQYTQLSAAADTIAERIRALDARAPGSFAEFLKITSLEEADAEVSDAEMVGSLLISHATISMNLGRLIAAATEARDDATLDMLITRKEEHDKATWMLKSTLEQ